MPSTAWADDPENPGGGSASSASWNAARARSYSGASTSAERLCQNT